MEIRPATRADLPAVIRMLADDPLGATRERFEDPLPAAYETAFAAMARQEGNQLLVAIVDGEVAGCLQLTFIPGLSRLGMTRAQIEGVRVSADRRGAGIGRALFEDAIARARTAGCGLVQLTTDKARPDARAFYDSLGFEASHTGMKLAL